MKRKKNCSAIYLPSAARILERRPTTAWKPAETFCTDFLAPQVSHVSMNIRFSLLRIVSGDLHVWHVTYSPAKSKRTTVSLRCYVEEKKIRGAKGGGGEGGAPGYVSQ